MRSTSTFKIVLTSLFAALVCVATMFIRFPSPTGGYINPGDAIVLLSAFLLGPVYGALASGIGSMLADIFSGYPAYAIGTLVIKAGIALAAGAIFHRANSKKSVVTIIMAGICGEAIMVLGYFIFTALFLSYGWGAVVEIPGNLVQAAFGIIAAALLTPAMLKSHEIREMLEKLR